MGFRKRNSVSLTRTFEDVAKSVRVRKSDPCALLEEKTVLFHAAYHIEVAEPYVARRQHEAVEPGEIVHAEKREQLFRLCLDLLYHLIRKTRRAVIGHMSRRQIFFR